MTPPRDDEAIALLAPLHSDEHLVRTKAELRLSALCKEGLSLDATIQLIESTRDDFPADVQSSILLHAVATNPHADLIPVLRLLLVDVLPVIRPRIVRLLGQIGTAAAMELILETLETNLPDGGFPMDVWGNQDPLYWLAREPVHPEVVFPRLLALRRFVEFTPEVDRVVLAYLEAGLLDPGLIVSEPGLLRVLLRSVQERRRRAVRRAATAARRARSDARQWWSSPDYVQSRHQVATMIHALGHIDHRLVRAELHRWLEVDDPMTRLAAVVGLIRLGEEVDQGMVEYLAGIDEVRNELFDRLGHIGAGARFPDRWHNQPAFAASEMARWLAFPTELASPPHGLELVALVAAADDAEYYLFKFTAGANEPWCSGLAGPYSPGDAPTTESPGGTFSTFEPFADGDAAGAATRIIETVHAVSQP